MYRTLLTLAAVLLVSAGGRADQPKKLLLLGQGPDGHPPQTHEYLAGVRLVEKCLRSVPGLEMTVANADEPWREGPELLARADGVVIFLSEGSKWMHADPQRLAALRKLAARGGGFVGLHWGIGGKDARYIDGCLQLLGGCHGGPDRKYTVLATTAEVVAPNHPIASGLASFPVKDEFYYRLKFVPPEGSIRPILQVKINDQPETVAWAWDRPDGGRSFGFSGLHFHDNWRLLPYRRLVAQAVLWSLKLPVPKEGLPVVVTDDDLKRK
jgi:type 1 glutamine amidotransferase